MNNRVFFFIGILVAIFTIYKISTHEPEVEQQAITVEHVREAINLTRNVTDKVDAYFDDFRNLPISNKEAGLPSPNEITSENVKSVTIYGNRVMVKFKKHLPQGARFDLKADFSKTQPIKLEWRCIVENINKAFFEEVYPECMYTDSDVMEDLMQAIHQKDIAKIEVALDNGADINGELNGDTPLLMAIVRGGKVEVIEYLLDNDADIEQGTSYYSERTPLMVALTNSNKEVVTLLVERGADVNATDKNGKTILQQLREGRTYIETPYYEKLLLDAGAEDPSQF
ncbi:MAG: ankyrin repeat domain-containing protein [Gammaproteobacteria bacterium]